MRLMRPRPLHRAAGTRRVRERLNGLVGRDEVLLVQEVHRAWEERCESLFLCFLWTSGIEVGMSPFASDFRPFSLGFFLIGVALRLVFSRFRSF